MNTVGFIVEEQSAQLTLSHLLKVDIPEERIIPMHGRTNMIGEKYKDVIKRVKQLKYTQNCDKVIVLIDAHCTDEAIFKRETLKPLRDNIQKGCRDLGITIMVLPVMHALEGWLLGDINALKKYLTDKLGITNPKVPNDIPKPEEVCSTPEKMYGVFESNKLPFYKKTIDGPGIAKYSNKDRIAELCPSFNELIKAIEDC